MILFVLLSNGYRARKKGSSNGEPTARNYHLSIPKKDKDVNAGDYDIHESDDDEDGDDDLHDNDDDDDGCLVPKFLPDVCDRVKSTVFIR